MSCNISEDRPGSMKNIVIEGSSELASTEGPGLLSV